MEDLLGDLVEEGRVLYLLLYLWLDRGVEFLSSVEVVLGDADCDTYLLHPADDDPPACLHLGV